MEKGQDFIETCRALTQLAILKDRKLEEKQLALMAKYLLSELSYQDIISACAYLAKRLPRFPDCADFFNLIAPMQSIEVLVEKEIGHLFDLIQGGYDNYKSSGVQLSEHQKELLEVWPWSQLAKMSVNDIAKIRTNMTFFLRNKIGSDGKQKLIMNTQAFVDYQSASKQLEQGEKDVQEKFIT